MRDVLEMNTCATDIKNNTRSRAVVHRTKLAVRTRGRNIVMNLKKKVLLVMTVFSIFVVGFGMCTSNTAHSDTGVQEVISYTVRPGDSLWTYASMVTPEGGDVSRSVDTIMELNNLDSPVLQTGQRIIVPDLG